MNATITVTEDDITIQGERAGQIILSATGGSEEAIDVSLESGRFSITAEQAGELQLALLNFSNTGFFDREG